jgi:starch synthase
LFLSAEADPFVKIGGLGDVADALPRYLHRLSSAAAGGGPVDIRLVLPLHSVIRPDRFGLRPVARYDLRWSGETSAVQVHAATRDGVPVYFLEAAPISRTGSVYSADPTLDAEKYTSFSLAALELPRVLGWRPDVVHANDWHTALACYALLLRRREEGLVGPMSVLTIHNLAFTGPDVTAQMRRFGLGRIRTGLPEWADGKPLPLGIWAADSIVAVSPSYAEEIQTAAFGCGLEDYLHARRDSLHGILNGIDDESYNPALDPALAVNYGLPTLERRSQNTAALREKLEFPAVQDAPLLAIISRLDKQKGLDFLPQVLRRLRESAWQLVVLGTGAVDLERKMRRLADEFPDRVRVKLEFDPDLARQIYAGADALLMPSRYEPCGLAQLIAMRYGCVPIVTAVGGLKDTVQDAVTGFIVPKPSVALITSTIQRALDAYVDRPLWTSLQQAGMTQDFSWRNSAAAYLQLYETLLKSEIVQ